MKKLMMLALLMAFPAVGWAAGAASDDVSWELPTQRVDGAPLPVTEIAGVEIEVRSGGTVVATDVFPPSVLEWVYVRPVALQRGLLCYYARTVDTDGQVSDWTEPACKDVKARPGRPSNLRVR